MEKRVDTGPPRPPDYIVWAAGPSGKGKVGAAWKNDDGTLSLTLNPFVVLSSTTDLTIKLYPNDEAKKPPPRKRIASSPSTGEDAPPDGKAEPIPF